jgi:hypothetical protein
MQKDYATTMNMSANGNINLTENNTLLNSKTYSGFTFEDNVKLTGAIKNMETVHQSQTELNTLVNSLNNMNNFIQGTQTSESKRLQDLNTRSVSDLYKMKAEFMNVRNDISINEHNNNIIKISLLISVVVCAIAMLTRVDPPLIDVQTAAIACGVVGAVYIIIIIIMYKSSLRRRNDIGLNSFSANLKKWHRKNLATLDHSNTLRKLNNVTLSSDVL